MTGEFVGLRIGVDLISGKRIHGRVSSWNEDVIVVVEDKTGSKLDIPRGIIVRNLVLLEGGE